MKKDEVQTSVDSKGHVQMFDYTAASEGTMLEEDGKTPVVVAKDRPAPVLKQVDVNNDQVKALVARLTHGFHDPTQEKQIIQEIKDLGKQSRILLSGGSTPTEDTSSSIPDYGTRREEKRRGSSTTGKGLLGTIPSVEPG